MIPLNPDDKDDFNRLDNALKCIDPALTLVSSDNEANSIDSLKQFYFDNYGVPGTSKFEERLEEINRNGG